MSKPNPTTQVFPDWLAVSTDGFASMNAGREHAHLVKELVQNALDALSDQGGEVVLDAVHTGEHLLVTCRDNGCGVENLADIRTVFHTSKTDSHLQRGRMGRGFKEMLCLAAEGSVTSGSRRIEFYRDGQQRRTRIVSAVEPVRGTLVQMAMPWGVEVIATMERYFQRLLLPATARLIVNGKDVRHRSAAHRVEASLPTELFESGRWIRPQRQTVVELVPLAAGEEAYLYEMGIPVCPVDWSVPYHANVMQRVPMNPCRDAVASGYLLKLHKAALPVLLPELSDEQVRQDWVGSAAPHCDAQMQQEIISRGFGDNIARSVPKMGARQFDEDAREIGTTVIDTRQTSGGFRQILQQHVPTTRQVVEDHNRKLVQAAAAGSFAVGDVYKARDDASVQRRAMIEAVGGPQRVQLVMDFARWFCQKLLDGYQNQAVCSVTLAILKDVDAIATWSSSDVLTLGIDTPWLWTDPLGEGSLSVLIHEAAHHLNAHHGRDFHAEIEKLAGRAARVMLECADYVRSQYETIMGEAHTSDAKPAIR